MWPQSAEGGKVPGYSVKSAVSTEIEAKPEKTPQIILSTEPILPTQPASKTALPPTHPLSDPKPGSKTVIDGKPHIWLPGFGWIEDQGGKIDGNTVDGEGDINKQVGVMSGGTMIGNPGDELTGHKVGIMDGGTVAEEMYENGIKSV